MRHTCLVTVLCSVFLAPVTVFPLDLKNAVIVTSPDASVTVGKASQTLVEEILKRTQARLRTSTEWRSGQGPAILLGTTGEVKRLAGDLADQLDAAPVGDEGFRIQVLGSAVIVAGNSDRAVLFGAGYLLRHLRMSYGKIVEVDGDLRVSTAPKHPVRGHELGFRPKVNSYDGFTVEMWEQYIRDLAVFGTNAIELIPPRSDDAEDSPHFPLPQIEMMQEVSRIADEYDLDVWIWYPALDEDYSDPDTVEFAVNEWAGVFTSLPRIDHVFVPAGDPGDTPPRYLMALLEKQAESLKRFHPDARMWVGAEGLTKESMEEMYEIIEGEPEWLAGVVHGPWVRDSIPELRRRLPERYPIRRYPDITHSRHAQYFVPDWDLAFMVTQAREVCNPRPLDHADIFRAYQDFTIGFVAYSEGVNDDVNKIIWSSLGWNPDAMPVDILREYGRYFIVDEWADEFAQGILALERNWRGPLITNEGVETTFQMFRAMEKNASPQVKLNWRFQQALYRAYYDAYVRSRLLYETSLENQSLEQLREAGRTGSLLAVQEAESLLDLALTRPVSRDLRSRLFELGEALFQSVRVQLSVDRYQAISAGRGANLETVDVPLNNRLWLKQRFTAIRGMEAEADRLEAIEEIVNWTNPGPGGFYDDLGNLSRQPHLVRGPGYPSDPAHLASSYVNLGPTGFGERVVQGEIHRRAASFEQEIAYPISWWRTAGTLYDQPLRLEYQDLDPQARYRVKFVYGGGTTKIRLVADGRYEIHPWMNRPSPAAPLEFDIPSAATADGKLELTFMGEPGGGAGRGTDVAEIWLMKAE